jgi:arylsulfatase A-like enzyme
MIIGMKVLVLHANALHVGFLGCFGNAWVATPNLDRLAAEGIVFDQHFAGDLGCTNLDGALNALQDVTKRVQLNDPDLGATVDTAIDAVANLAGKPRSLYWIDLPSLHPPWKVADEFTLPYLDEVPAEEDTAEGPLEPLRTPIVGEIDRDDLILWERLRCTYAGAVTCLDAGIGLLLDALEQRSLLDDVTLVFTAERGLALGEHGIVGDYRPWLHEEVVHLPLIVRQPGAADAGLRVSALTQPADLAATLLDQFGKSVPAADGKSWLQLLRGEVEAIRTHCVSAWKLSGFEERTLRTTEWAYLLPSEQPSAALPRIPQLYVKPEDRWEMNNVVQHHWEVAEQMEKKLRSLLSER